ncbi:hypothetical protein OEZ66_29435, partial [Escherichia coli]|nr:hypothetical protein [Escherichia coli]
RGQSEIWTFFDLSPPYLPATKELSYIIQTNTKFKQYCCWCDHLGNFTIRPRFSRGVQRGKV